MLTEKAIWLEKVPFRSIDEAIGRQNCSVYFVESMIVGQSCTFCTSILGNLAPNPYIMLTRLDVFIHICEIYKVDITFFKSNVFSTK
jgi:hypothetical protein